MDIKYLVIDVDGTMTDGGLYYDENGNETKKFCTKDAAGFFAAHQVGMKIMVLTGRECKATTRRMTEMKVEYLCQNVKDKVNYLRNFMGENGIKKEEIGYIGDDLNDLPPMKLCGYVGCPEDACLEVKKIADYISPVKGGYGAVRDVIEHLLRENNLWNEAVSKVYGIGV
ncbi:MAG: HAD-IIIA family hydrolase [Clostridia bacterium]|nr:HAD-IIIA family hydrolase [Clostridia bacterium]NCD03727.1 HAD-IIIA family hydrolase [Clostridia bacterium]